jgi:ketosteroid isomerase-like protein
LGSNAAGEVVGRFYEQFGAGNIDAALSVCADDLEIIDPGMGQVRGRDRFREYLETFKRAMPDARAIVEQTVESGETVAVEGTFHRHPHGSTRDGGRRRCTDGSSG